MLTKYDIEFSNESINRNLIRLINQVYKLLPNREEGLNWDKPLKNIIEEFAGMQSLFQGRGEDIFFSLICKLEGLLILTEKEDFLLYRKTIFECIDLIKQLRQYVQG